MSGTHAVTVEYDGCCNLPDMFVGSKDECARWIALNYDRLDRRYRFREDFADGPVIRDLATGRLCSFVIPHL